MKLIASKEAMERIKQLVDNNHHQPRIDAEVAGGCGISVRFKLVFDGKRPTDSIIDCDGIPIQIDRFTKRYLSNKVKIDYQSKDGFTIDEGFDSGACQLHIG